MLFTNADMTASAAQLRQLALQMRGTVDSLRSASIWAGDDALRFMLEWDEKVSEPLNAAADKLDGLGLQEIIHVVTNDGGYA